MLRWRCIDVAVAEHLGDVFEGCSLSREICGGGVPEAMGAEPAHPTRSHA